MKSIFLKIFLGIAIIFALVITFVLMSWEQSYDAPYPELYASSDSTIIERGKYLVFGPAHCGTCHVPIDKIPEVEAGLIMPLKGGWELEIPPGTFRAPNITPDKNTGIGRYTDPEIARILRYSVKPDGTALFPFMPFQNMSDDDIVAIISFLRSQEPISNKIERSEPSFLGKFISAFNLMPPENPIGIPPKSMVKDTTIAYGKYLASSIANCMGCHTDRNLQTGEFIGTPFAGGFAMPPDEFSNWYQFVTPNLTPDKETGVIANWSQEDFIRRFRQGKIHNGTPMPWGSFSRIDETELKAIYNFLHSLDPVYNKIPQTVYAPGEEIPES